MNTVSSVKWQRLEQRIIRELAGLIFERSKKDDDLGWVSIIRTQVTKDYSQLRVWVSLFHPQESENQRTWLSLLRHHKSFQGTLSRKLRLRSTPKIIFVRDKTIQQGDQTIDKILQ